MDPPVQTALSPVQTMNSELWSSQVAAQAMLEYWTLCPLFTTV
jgi:hypothetical protein